MTKKEEKEYNIDTMAGVGKKVQIAGREYEILPVNIEDMVYIIGDNIEERLVIIDKETVEKENSWLQFGFNLLGKRKDIFIKMINKYVFYKERPMNEKMLIEHNWSFREIAKFMFIWIEEISE